MSSTPPLGTANFGSLVGTLSPPGTIFPIGYATTLQVAANGVLFLGINDMAYAPADNSGALVVDVAMQ